jgi:hypothetical protein
MRGDCHPISHLSHPRFLKKADDLMTPPKSHPEANVYIPKKVQFLGIHGRKKQLSQPPSQLGVGLTVSMEKSNLRPLPSKTHDGSMVLLYMVTFTINIPKMLAYIPYMGPMGMHMHPWPKRSRFEVWLREGSRDGKRTLDRKNMQLCCMARLRLSIAACLFRMQHLAIAPYRIVSKLISKTS